MKKLLCLSMLIIMFINLTACNNVDLSTTTSITPPKVAIPINGVWKVERYVFSAIAKVSEEEAKDWIGQKASFSEEKVILPDDNCEKPKFRVKSVETKTYLYNNYKSFMESLGISQNEIKVITITSNENYFRDIIEIDSSTIVIIKEGAFFFLSKQSSEGEIIVNNNEKRKKISSLKSEAYVKDHESGLLLGLKYYKTVSYKLPYINEKKPILEPVYRTLWISYDGSIQEVLELPFLLVPRRTGFWRLETQREIANNYGLDLLIAAPIGKEKKTEGIKVENHENTYFHDLKSINFVGNDYVCYEREKESGIKGNTQSIAAHSLEVVPLDTIYTGSQIPIAALKVLGEKAIEALNSGAKSYLRAIPEEHKELLEYAPSPTNFGVLRDHGKWLLRGRLNYLNASAKHEYADFNVPMVAPENLVSYDSLFPSFEVIKQKVPSAVDAYTSPNKDIAVILTNSKLLVYAMRNNILEEFPLSEVELKSSEVSVMAQWALDDYVKLWSKQVRALEDK